MDTVSYQIPSSIQEALTQYAEFVNNINSVANDFAGIDVMWFRAVPDKRSQDVIFQSYTLYGVEDCPLQFKAVYTEAGYDDAAITYQIMGLNYSVPLTLEISLDTWKRATGDDGTIPQKNDIVFIPINRKLLQVVSMTPVKKVAAQLTAYKVNLSVYTPTRSRVVGENLQESIKENTTNLNERFGKEIDDTLKNIVDNNQLSLYTSTSQDEQKHVVPTVTDDSGILDVRNIISFNLVVDGHTVARNCYDMNIESNYVVSYKRTDSFKKSSDARCYTCWVDIKESDTSKIKNVKDVSISSDLSYIITTAGNKFKVGDNIVFRRGKVIVPGIIETENKIKVNSKLIEKLNKMNPSWYKTPGFTITEDRVVNLLTGICSDGEIDMSIKGNSFISISYGGSEKLIQIPNELKFERWYGVTINVSDTISVDIYSSDDGLNKYSSISNIVNDIVENVDVDRFYMKPSHSYLTNIRLYKDSILDIDKQIKNLVMYNAKNDSLAIINDSADTYLNKPFVGKQR